MSNRLKNKQNENKISIEKIENNCVVKNHTIVFSFKYFTDSPEYSLLNKSADHDCINSFFGKLRTLSNQTWNNFKNIRYTNGGSGTELIPVSQMQEKFIGCLKNVSRDEKLYITKFDGTKYRMFLKKGTKCQRVVYVLACEINLNSAYKHKG